jgi:phosphatidylserine/phosphatidylglycerophosphate/cardiolipin synthase-like enzyme
MAEFLTTRGTASHIEDIINHAKTSVVLISPYVRVPEGLLQCLKDAANRKVKITLVYGKKELEPDVRNQLEQLGNNLSLRFLEKLHAKCFFNEDNMVITSMNLYDFSELNNEEMGVLISAKDDQRVFSEATRKAQSIINSAEKIQLKDTVVEKVGKRIVKIGKLVSDSLIEEEPKGHCIKCGKDIAPYNKDLPFCSDCWKPGVKLGRFCYKCGKEKQTTKEKPLCNSCYRKPQKGS